MLRAARVAVISIHALREEGDMRTMYRVQTAQTFLSTPSARRATLAKFDEKTGLFISIHALREEGDDANVDQLARENEFLSTPSARRATP